MSEVLSEIVWCRVRKYAESRDGTWWGIGLSPDPVMWVRPHEVDQPDAASPRTVHVRMTRAGAVKWGWGEAILPDWTEGTRALCARRCEAVGDAPCWRLPELAVRPVGAPAPAVAPCRDCLVGRAVEGAA